MLLKSRDDTNMLYLTVCWDADVVAFLSQRPPPQEKKVCEKMFALQNGCSVSKFCLRMGRKVEEKRGRKVLPDGKINKNQMTGTANGERNRFRGEGM